eukprot:s3134_g6.t1
MADGDLHGALPSFRSLRGGGEGEEQEIDEINYRDHCLIIVGDGGVADELLAKRRLAAGGRLVHFQVDDEDQVVLQGEEEDVIFAWQPYWAESTSTLGRKLGPSFKTHWTKSGPDCIKVQPGQSLQISSQRGQLRHVRYLDQNSEIKAEVSGEVILRPDLPKASELEVEVTNPELLAYGTFSWRRVFRAMAIWTVVFIFRWYLAIFMELRADEGDFAWWRGVEVAVNCFNIFGPLEIFGASMSGESSYQRSEAILSVCTAVTAVLVCNVFQIANLPLTCIGLPCLYLTGGALQYVNTRWKHPTRRFLPCLMWSLANVVGTLGVASGAAAVVVSYSLLLAIEWKVFAAFFLPCSTAVLEIGMVVFTQLTYTRLVIEQRPHVPGDISFVAMPYMLAASHAFSESARMVATFSGAVTTGQYSWVGSLAVTLFLNVLTRTGWIRFGLYCMTKNIFGVRPAQLFAPKAWSQLHNEIKIYAGYFRFIVLISLVIARGMVHQDLSLNGPRAPAFNTSAACAVLGLLVLECIEDNMVLRQVVPMSPVLAEMIQAQQEGGVTKHQSLVSMDLRKSPRASGSSNPWRLDELNERGARISSSPNIAAMPLDCFHLQETAECGGTEFAPVLPQHTTGTSLNFGQQANIEHVSGQSGPSTGLDDHQERSMGRHMSDPFMEDELNGSQLDADLPHLVKETVESPDAGAKSSGVRPVAEESIEYVSEKCAEELSAGSDGSSSAEAVGLWAPSDVTMEEPAPQNIQISVTAPERRASTGPQPKAPTIQSLVRGRGPSKRQILHLPSLGPRTHSKLREIFGQPRQVVPSLLLHGLRKMSWGAQCSFIGITCEVTTGFLNTTLGPGFVRGIVTEPCGTFDALVMLWWPVPMTC